MIIQAEQREKFEIVLEINKQEIPFEMNIENWIVPQTPFSI